MTTKWHGSSDDLDLLTCSPDAVVDSVYSLKRGFPRNVWEEVCAAFDVPAHELETSPISSRIAWLAVNQGALFAHHELKSALPLPDHLGPESAHTQPAGWVGGALVEPRHFSFGQDHRIQTFHPNHRAQWRPHELAHALSGFFWHPTLTRFELYLSSRLNELLPIIHWYGWDRIARPSCLLHAKTETYRQHCETCAELASKPWWESAQSIPKDQDLFWAKQGLQHFRREWQAINDEFQSGARVKTPRGPLDASSDALGYLDGHWNRSTSWGFGRWVETCLKPGVDYFDDFRTWLENHYALHLSLFCGEFSAPSAEAGERRLRRTLQEMGYRALIALEHLPEESHQANACEDILAPWLESIHKHLVREDSDSSVLKDLVASWFELIPDLRQQLPSDVAKALPGLGLRQFPESCHLEQLQEGLASVDIDVDQEQVAAFVDSPYFAKTGFLIERWTDFAPTPQSQDAAFFQRACGRDEDGEFFAALPDLDESIPLSELRLNKTAQWRESTTGDWDCAFSWHGEVRLITCSLSERLWLMSPKPEGIPDDLGTWLEMGLLLWLPAPKSRDESEI